MNVSYVVKRIKNINYKNMWEKVQFAHRKSGKNTLRLLTDMVWCGLRYEAGYMDYIICEFWNLDSRQRRTYVTRGIQNDLVIKLNDKAYFSYFVDKALFNKTFAEFVHRAYCNLNEISEGEFAVFMKGRSAVIAKPVDGMCGEGVTKLFAADFPDAAAMYAHLKGKGLCLVEEVIEQHPAIQEIYPDAVNTVRMVTVLDNEGNPDIVFAGIRIGSNGSMLDNMATGGMCAKIDIETGVIVKPGVTYANDIHFEHPITKKRLLGFPIPHYSLVVETVKAAARRVPQVRYVGWDVAVTPDGIDLIEGNEYPGHLIIQAPAHLDGGIGMLPVFQKYM